MDIEEALAERKWLMDYIYRTQGEDGILLVSQAWKKEWNRRQRNGSSWKSCRLLPSPVSTSQARVKGEGYGCGSACLRLINFRDRL